MKNKEYIKTKKEYLRYKKWCMKNLDIYIENKKTIEKIESGDYPNYILHMPTKKIEQHLEKLRNTIVMYETITELVKQAEGYGLQLVSKRIN